MEQLTYHRYLADPTVREQIDEEVRRLHREAIDRYIVAPVRNALARLRAARRSRPSPALVLSRDTVVETTIGARQTLRVEDAAGFDVEVGAGCLWVTLENDTRDYVVGSYDVFHVRRNGATLVHAPKAVSLRIAYRAAGQASVRSQGADVQATPALQLLAKRPAPDRDRHLAAPAHVASAPTAA